MNHITILFLGPAREWSKSESIQLEMRPGGTITLLKGTLAARYAGTPMQSPALRFAVNEEFAVDDRELRDGDVIAVIPPVSGG